MKNVAELIAYAKANPGKLSFGSSGVGAAAHLTSELMKQVTGIQMEHVPYKGTAPALADLASGNIQLLIDAPIGVMTQVRAGKIRALAMLSKNRVPGVEEVPTIVEAGGPLIEIVDLGDVPRAGGDAEGDRRQGLVRSLQGREGRGTAQAARRAGRDPRRATPEETGKFLQARSRSGRR